MNHLKIYTFGRLFTILVILSFVKSDLNKTVAKFDVIRLTLQLNENKNNSISLKRPFNFHVNVSSDVYLYFTYQRETSSEIFRNESFIGDCIVTPIPDFRVDNNETGPFIFEISAKAVGHVYIGVNSTDSRFMNTKSVFCYVEVVLSNKLTILISAIGWIYFAAWSVSFYPQIVLNFYRKSVVGLNFDFILFNWLGFFSYSLFNVGLFWIPSIIDIFHTENPRSVIQVQIQDVIFSLHALVIVTLQIGQCIVLERGNQKVSRIGWAIYSGMIVYIVVILCLACVKLPHFNWLKFLYYISYLKLFITIIKYIPQAYMNFKRKSTIGWSIGNVLLDFTGGILSILQMILVAYNNDDWNGLFSDPTKFGLGLFSVLFDILFMVQHYCLYRHPKVDSYEVINSDYSSDAETSK